MTWRRRCVKSEASQLSPYFFYERLLQLRYLYYPSSMKETPGGWEKSKFISKGKQYQSERLQAA